MLYTLSHYYLTTHIGRRASRDIYLSYPVGEPEHKVILKLYDPACRVPGTSVEDFFITARRFKQLVHAHLIPIIDIGLEEGKPYVVSDYIANGSLRQHLEQRAANRLNLDEALRIILDIGAAIVYAHAHTIIHKDIRPENILFNERGEALLGDFVLGEIIQERGIQHQLDTRTLNYMAPEQLNGISTPKSDQYALGCLLYELITGALPFGAGTGSLLDQQLTAEPKPPSAIVSGIPKALEMTILQALSRQQSERYPDVETFLNSLQAASKPEPPVFPFTLVLSQPLTADASTGEPAEETKHENTADGEDEDINDVDDQVTEQDDAEDEKTENEDVEGIDDQVMAADQDAEEEEDQDQAAPFFAIIPDPADEVANPADKKEEEDTQSTASSGSAQNTPSASGIGSPGIPSPRVMFPLMKQYSQQQGNTSAAGDDQDDPFAYSSTPISAAQPKDKNLDLSAMQYPKAAALILPASPVQQGQLAVHSQPQQPVAITPPQQSSRSYTIQPPSRRRANSFLLVALVSIILATILSASFNATILAMTGTLPATANALALKQTGTPGQPQATPTQGTPGTRTATTNTKPTSPGNKNQGTPKSNAKDSKPTNTGGAKGSSNQSVGTSGGGQPGTTSNPGTNPNPTPQQAPPPPPPTPALTSFGASGGNSYDAPVNLSNGGSIDWVHWGYGGGYNVDTKSGATPYISSVHWSTSIRSDTDQSNDFSWYDGIPHSSVSSITSGTDIPGTASFSVRSDPTPHTLTLYLGAYRAKGTLVISFGGTTVYTSSFDMSNDPTNPGDNTIYVIHYSSNVTSSIDISYAMTVAGGGANCVILEAATVS